MLTRKKHQIDTRQSQLSLIEGSTEECPSDEILLACREKERKKPRRAYDENDANKNFDLEMSRLSSDDTLDTFSGMEAHKIPYKHTTHTSGGFIKHSWSAYSLYDSPTMSKKRVSRSRKKASAMRKKPTLIASAQKKPWTDEEDKILGDAIETYGAQSWSRIAKCLPGRIGKQCRERWHNHLCPTVKKGNWTQEEDEIIFQQHKLVGNQWALIAKNVKGRTDNAVKNRYYSTMRKLSRQTAKSKRHKPSSDSIPRCELTIDTSLDDSNLDSTNLGCFQLSGYSNWIPKVERSPTGLSLPSGFQPISSAQSGHSFFGQE